MKTLVIKKNDFTNYYEQKCGYAECLIVEGWGYIVNIYFSDGKWIEEYSAGDCHKDSQIYGAGQLSVEKLIEFAKQTAEDMLKSHNLYIGDIIIEFDKKQNFILV